MIALRTGAGEGVADGAGVLVGEHHPPHFAAVIVMLEDLLADQLYPRGRSRSPANPPGRARLMSWRAPSALDCDLRE